MSLETEIKKLTAAIETLNATIKNQESSQSVVAGEPAIDELPLEATTEEQLELEEPTEEQFTHDQLRDLLMSKSRENSKLKATIKELLSKYGAAKVTDVKESDLPFIMKKARAL